MRCLRTFHPSDVSPCSYIAVNVQSCRWTVKPTRPWHATQHCSCSRKVAASQLGYQGSAQEEILQIQPGQKHRTTSRLAGLPFTFKSARSYLGARLSTSQLGSTVSPGDQELLNVLLEFHHDATSKKGPGVSHFTVNQSPHGATRCFWIHRVDGSCEDFSYLRCLKAWEIMHKHGMVDMHGFPTSKPPKMEFINNVWRISGVILDRESGQWEAHIWINGRQRFLGLFGSEEDAAAAYDTAVKAAAEASDRAQQSVVQQTPQLGGMIQSWQQEVHAQLSDRSDVGGSTRDTYSSHAGSSLSSYDLPYQDPYSSFDDQAQYTYASNRGQTGRLAGPSMQQNDRVGTYVQRQASNRSRTHPEQSEQQVQEDQTRWQPCLVAMRNAVLPSLKRFRNNAFQQHRPASTCSLTGQQLSSPEEATVNYAPPQSFKKLASAWMKLVGVRHPDQLLIQKTDDRLQWVMTDEGQSASWQTYHDSNARLQLISKQARQST